MREIRRRSGVAFRATIGQSLPLLYVLSFGPACWWLSKPHPADYFAIADRHSKAQKVQVPSPVTRLGNLGKPKIGTTERLLNFSPQHLANGRSR